MAAMKKKFHLGRVSVTLAASIAIAESGQDAEFFIDRRARSDWGFGCAEMNEIALAAGGPLFSVYETLGGVKQLVVTDPVNQKGKRTETWCCLPFELGKDKK